MNFAGKHSRCSESIIFKVSAFWEICLKTFKNDPKTNPKVDDGKRLDSPSLDVVLGKCGVSKRGGSSRGERAPCRGPAGGWRIYVGEGLGLIFIVFSHLQVRSSKVLEKVRQK